MTDPHPGDAWLTCTCGNRHWGVHGAAGLLLARQAPGAAPRGAPGAQAPTPDAPTVQVLLQHRALWSDQGGTWGVPGGALRPGEDPVAGALRESEEEAGVDPAGVCVDGSHVLDHGVWRYTTVVGWVSGPQHPRPTDRESLEIAWVGVSAVPELPLLPAFAAAWPSLRRLLAG